MDEGAQLYVVERDDAPGRMPQGGGGGPRRLSRTQEEVRVGVVAAERRGFDDAGKARWAETRAEIAAMTTGELREAVMLAWDNGNRPPMANACSKGPFFKITSGSLLLMCRADLRPPRLGAGAPIIRIIMATRAYPRTLRLFIKKHY